LLTGLCSLDAKVTLYHRFAVTCDIDDPERTHRQAKLAADALFFIDQDRVVSLMSVYRSGLGDSATASSSTFDFECTKAQAISQLLHARHFWIFTLIVLPIFLLQH
jgi:hypothetical protein